MASSSSTRATLLGLGTAAAGLALGYTLGTYHRNRAAAAAGSSSSSSSACDSSPPASPTGASSSAKPLDDETSVKPWLKELCPPFPLAVERLLRSAGLCYLATVTARKATAASASTPSAAPVASLISEPHLSLMKFTYVSEDEPLLVMTTRRDTQKLKNLERNPRVAILLHDFGPQEDEDEDEDADAKAGSGRPRGSVSVTLYGTIQILDQDSAREQRYRELHLANNRKYSQFIVGASIAVLTVKVRSARICNIQDRVTKWTAAPAASATPQ